VVDAVPDDALLLLQPDLHVPALAQAKVRRALLLALDRKAIANAYAEAAGRVAHTYRPDDAADFAIDATRTRYAPEDARKLLKDAGGVGPLPLVLTETTPGSGYSRAAELVVQQTQACPSPV
jgi:peptide/nickel transport system substrate-binding protein